jgi:TonB family protein
MNSTSFRFLVLVFAPFVCFAVPERPALLDGPVPIFPPGLFSSPLTSGHALVLCTIDDAGLVIDQWTLDSSHEAFAAESESALAAWSYAPAAPGAPAAPWPRIDVVQFDFSRSGHITAATHRDAAAAAFPAARPATARIEDLPLWPAAKLTRLEGRPPPPPAGTPAGEVRLEFLVDRSGRVRVPVVLEATQAAHARAAVAGVLAWKFSPLPTDLSAPAVRVRWSFRFPARD